VDNKKASGNEHDARQLQTFPLFSKIGNRREARPREENGLEKGREFRGNTLLSLRKTRKEN